MRDRLLGALSALLLLACTQRFPQDPQDPDPYVPGVEDSGAVWWEADADLDEPAQDADAGVSPRVDAAEEESESDAGYVGPDAGEPLEDAEPPSPEVDSSVPEDGGAPSADAGSPLPPADAAEPPPEEEGCAPDAFEENDTPETATLVESGTGWPHSTYSLTWSAGDSADWVAGELESTGVVGLFRVHAADSDSRSMVEVRVACPSGVAVCRGSNATLEGATCVGRRLFNAYVDVACMTAAPSPVTILVGAERGERECEHRLQVSLEPVGA